MTSTSTNATQKEITFFGTKAQVLNQLGCYMSKTDAQTFFETYFEQSEPDWGKVSGPKKVRYQTKNTQNTNKLMALRLANAFATDVIKPGWEQNGIVNCCIDMPPQNNFLQSKHTSLKNKHFCKRTKPTNLCFDQIAEQTIVAGKPQKQRTFWKQIGQGLFASMCVAADIALSCTLNVAAIGTLLTACSFAFGQNTKSKKQNAEAACIASIVFAKNVLPKYKNICNSTCKNLCLQCNFRSETRCKLTKEKFVQTVNYLLNKGILVLENKQNDV